jgi:hypothetical protein
MTPGEMAEAVNSSELYLDYTQYEFCVGYRLENSVDL